MGFFDFLTGEESSVDWKDTRTGQQKKMGKQTGSFLNQLFQPGGWNKLMPTQEMFAQLDPSVMGGMEHMMERGASSLQERLGGMGFSGGSGMAGMGQYYGDAMPQMYGQLAGMMGPALQMPYQMAGNLWQGSQQPGPMQGIVNPGQQGALGPLLQMGGAIGGGAMMGYGMGGGFDSMFGGGNSPMPGSGFGGTYMGPPPSYNPRWSNR
jgi:hypothetical protein